MKRLKKLTLWTLVGLFLVALPITVLAASKQFEQSIYVAPEEIINGNFIKAGSIIDINGVVNGDVIVAGNTVTISGSVAGDVIAAANTIVINGQVGGSVRVAGSAVQINGAVEHNVWAVGGTVGLGSDSTVGWDVYSGAGSVEVKGKVGGNLWLGAGTVVIANEIGKDVLASVDTEGHIILYPTAVVNGNLTYQAAGQNQLELKEGAQILGETKQKALAVKKPDAKKAFAVINLFWKIVSLFSLLILGIIMLALVPKKMLEVNDEMIKNPWSSLGWGLIYLLLTPIIVLLLLITIIGIPLALIILPLYFVVLYLSKVLAGFAIGLLIMNQTAKAKYKGSLIWPLILGLAIFIFISSIPVFGWAVKLILVLWALGALMQVKRETLKEYR